MWNDEDLSIFSRDQQDSPRDINCGGRALEAVVRPYPLATAGEPLQISFDMKQKYFNFLFRHSPVVSDPTLIFLPRYQYPQGFNVEISDGEFEFDYEGQILRYKHGSYREIHTIHIKPKKN